MSVDLVKLMDSPTAIVGTTGAGKTFAAKGVVEKLLNEKRRVIVIDPTGAWYGLRAGSDGSAGNGFPVLIFGGDHADIEISSDGGEKIAEALATRDVQAIIDTSEMTGGEKTRFLTAFFEKIYALNKAALHLIVDEADEICPQNPMPDERRLSGAFDKIVRRGRIKGFRPVMITQRPAVLHKNVLSQISTLIALKLTSPQDRKAIDDWVKGNADTDQARLVMTTLSTLLRGEGWVWSPASDVLERMNFPAIKTFDSSRTPEIGETQLAPALTNVDVEDLREALSQSDNDTTEVDKPNKISKDRGRLVADAERRGFDKGLKDGIERGKTQGIAIGLAKARNALDALRIPDIQSDAEAPLETPALVEKPKKIRKITRQTTADLSIDPLLKAAQSVHPVKLSWNAIAAMCGRKAKGGYFNTKRKALIENGFVSDANGVVTVLKPDPMTECRIPADLLEENLPEPSAKMFTTIRQNPGLTVNSLARILSMQPRGGHWNTGMSILRKNGLILEQGGLLQIAQDLLPPPTPPMEE